MRIKTSFLALAAGLAFGGAALAQSGGYTGPSQAEAPASQQSRSDRYPQTTVKQLLDSGRDDQKASLRGRIVSHIKGDHYKFEDDTGSITVDIDDDEFPAGQSIGADQQVELQGEFDRDDDGVEFDVDRVVPMS